MSSLARIAVTLVLCFLQSSSAAPSNTAISFVVKESIDSPGSFWTNIGSPPSHHVLNLRIALPQSDYATLEQHLYDISSPDSARYGSFFTKEQVESFVQPKNESVAAVENWLVQHGFDLSRDVQRSPAGDWLKVAVPVVRAEEMLQTKYSTWKHADGTRVVRTTEYSLPSHLHQHIEFIQPTTLFSRTQGIRRSFVGQAAQVTARTTTQPTQAPSSSIVDPSCATQITISCLQQIYDTVGYQPNSHNGNQIGVTGYLEEYANQADLQTFYARQRPDAVNSTFKEVFVNGGTNPQNSSLAGPEAGLDVQFAFGLTFPMRGTFYSTAGMPPFIADANEETNDNEPYLDWLEFLLSQEEIPQTISTSYGDEEQTVPKNYAVRVCQSFAQLGARGVSLLFGSGDSGVAGSNPETQICLTNDGRNATRFLPNFPASCPFVTAVGATQGFSPEIATTGFASGGGFSNYFARPSYADTAVANFFEQFSPQTYAGLFNPNGAPIPDVSAQGDHYQIIFEGVQIAVGGASAATPTFASIVALLNDARINQGKHPLGWLNPMLYSRGLKGLTDITVGSNPGCGTPGFNATKGWDPVTGLGTPNFPKLKEIVLQFQ